VSVGQPVRKLRDAKVLTCAVERSTLAELNERARARGVQGWTRSDEVRLALARYLGERPVLRAVGGG